jgi:hypothetical protein
VLQSDGTGPRSRSSGTIRPPAENAACGVRIGPIAASRGRTRSDGETGAALTATKSRTPTHRAVRLTWLRTPGQRYHSRHRGALGQAAAEVITALMEWINNVDRTVPTAVAHAARLMLSRVLADGTRNAHGAGRRAKARMTRLSNGLRTLDELSVALGEAVPTLHPECTPHLHCVHSDLHVVTPPTSLCITCHSPVRPCTWIR